MKRRTETGSGGGKEFSAPIPMSVLYIKFLGRLHTMDESKGLPSNIIIYNTLSNYFVGPLPTNASALSLRDKRRIHDTAKIPMLKRGQMWRITRGVMSI